jgi:hypothetical protein
MNIEKSNEINKITSFCGNLPDGYLQDIFKDILPMIVNAIQNDMCIIPFWEMMQSKMDLNKEIIQLKKEEHKLKTDIRSLENNKEFLENSLAEAKRKMSTMAKMMLNAV